MRVTFEELYEEFLRVLRKYGFSEERAKLSARLFAETSRDGVASHGLNRFPGYIKHIERGLIDVNATPELVERFGAFERWDGRAGPGNLNAWCAMDRAITLAREQGVGCVALKNTNHWMRAGSYGLQAAGAGCIGVCWTNTIKNMPPWGGRQPAIGNNPLVICAPRAEGPVLLDMAMSQFSMGKLQTHRLQGAPLPLEGGYDANGALTTDAAAILESGRMLPAGFWKGSGLSIMLDLTAALLSGGKTTAQISLHDKEFDVSQVFIALDALRIAGEESARRIVEEIIASIHDSAPAEEGASALFPGERTLARRKDSLAHGVPVEATIWAQVKAL